MATERAMIYCRVSSTQQGKGYSIPTQLEACRQFCSQRGYMVVGEFADEFTGTESDRPGIGELTAALGIERPEVVVSYDLDRLLGRDELGQVLIKYEILGAGARIEYVLGGGHDAQNGDSEMLEGFKAIWARHENTQRVERMRRGRRGRVESGYPIVTGARAPFGFNYISEPHKGTLEINEKEAEIVRQMYQWLVTEGRSSYWIAKQLSEMGVLTAADKNPGRWKKAGRGQWAATTVRRILANPINKGEYIYGQTRTVKRRPGELKPDGSPFKTRTKQVKLPESQWIRLEVPAIVDADTWERAQSQLAENKAMAARNTKRKYLLRGMIFCQCGRRWTGRFRSARDIAYYRCPTTEAEPWRSDCETRFSIRQDVLETAVWGAVSEFLLNPEQVRKRVEQLREEHAEEVGQHEQRLEAVRAGLVDIDRQLSSLLDQALEGFPADIVDQKRGELVKRRHDLATEQRRLEALNKDATVTPDVAAMLANVTERVRKTLPYFTFEDKRRMLQILRVRIDVLDQEHIRLSGVMSPAIVNTSSLSGR